MALISPNTDLRLLSVPLIAGDGQQMDFATAAAQAAYFQGKTVKTYSDFTYQRKDQYIRVPEDAEHLYNCNYVMYRNTGHGNKWFYAFITRIEFVNQNCAHVHIKTDVFQTWLFDFTFLRSLVVRECVADDTVWTHTIPENIACGETVSRSKSAMLPAGVSLSCSTSAEFDTNYYVCIAMAERIETIVSGIAYPIFYTGGRPDSMYYYACSRSQYHLVLGEIEHQNKSASIVSVFPVPKSFVTFNSLGGSSPDYTSLGYLSNDDSAQFKNVSANKNSSDLNGYVPKNKKLFCYPYNYAEIQNGQQSAVFKYEDFDALSSSAMEFAVVFTLSQSPMLGIYPKNYKHELRCVGETLTANDFPLVPYQYDAYSAYLAQNTSQLGLSLYDMAGQVFLGSALGNAGMLAGGLSSLSNFAARQSDLSRQPRQMRNVAPGNYINMTGRNGFYLIQKTIKAEYARIVDDYFSRYGYRVDTLKVPSFKNRPEWDYLLTDRCAISGDIPADDAAELQNLFNSGLTVWHDPAHFGDYSRNNAPA